MPRGGVTNNPQTSIFDEEIESGDLLAACEELVTARDDKKEATKDHDTKREAVKEALTTALTHPPEEGIVYRCGSFVLVEKNVEGGDRSFTAKDRKTLSVKPVAEVE